MHNNGIGFKMFIQDLMSKTDEVVKFEVGGKEIVLADQRQNKAVDVFTEVSNRLEESKYRRDKRKILQQYSLQPSKPWGLMEKHDIKKRPRDIIEQRNKVFS